jgi:hypothetical protein
MKAMSDCKIGYLRTAALGVGLIGLIASPASAQRNPDRNASS